MLNGVALRPGRLRLAALKHAAREISELRAELVVRRETQLLRRALDRQHAGHLPFHAIGPVDEQVAGRAGQAEVRAVGGIETAGESGHPAARKPQDHGRRFLDLAEAV